MSRSLASPGVGDAIGSARALGLDLRGCSRHVAARIILGRIDALAREDEQAFEESVVHGFLAGSDLRFEEHVAPAMRSVDACDFRIGTPDAHRRHFCGETPRRPVHLSAFEITTVPVTAEQFAVFDPTAVPSRRTRRRPLVGVTWHEASLFAMWMGARLPTEAEWEFACGCGSEGEWCCADEDDLAHHAWYSENSRGELRDVGTREPNALGLHDLHGNVWEWCRDAYVQDFYSRAPLENPEAWAAPDDACHRVVRGGSVHALAEMCRTRYRLHEPPGFRAGDLGFRLARSSVEEGTASW